MAAKKKQAKEEVVVEATVEKTPQPKKKVNTWEIKDRAYILKNGKAPLTRSIKTGNMFYFDDSLGYERELRYTTNQKSVFVDEFQGQARYAHIVFENGTLFVPKEKQTLQKLLSIYHPHKDVLYREVDEVKEAQDDLQNLEVELEAMTVASNLDIEQAEAIMRVEIGSNVDKISSKELKRDLLVFARNNPELLLDLVKDDNVHLRNIGIKATEYGIIKLSSDNRTFSWGTNDRKLMTVPFDEHPYSALAAWFKTDEGMEVLNSIEKKLK